MLRMIQSKSSEGAKSYFNDALTKSDYYLSEQELPGRFHGKLAERLGIGETVTKKLFHDLCDNIDSRTGKSLTLRTNDDRTIGYDITFNAPKSVSIMSALTDDGHIIKAFEQAVSETMREIERDAMARVRIGGKHEDRKTRELIWSSFLHQTARPADGSLPDMHLHTHNYVFNVTWDELEQKFKAGQFRDIKRDMPYYQAIHQKKLSDKLIALGYDIRRTKNAFEIVGIPQAAIDWFSKRTNEIGQIAKEQGITDAKTLSELGARTRAKKQKGLTMDELKTEWRNQIRNNPALAKKEHDAPIRYAPERKLHNHTTKECVEHAVHHKFERASVVQDRRVLETAYLHGIGTPEVTLGAINEEFAKDQRIIRISEKYRTLCTTIEALIEEKQMIGLARQAQNKFAPIYDSVPYFDRLNDEQNAAVKHVLTTTHGVSIVRGVAGAGKTTMMPFATKLMNEAGMHVVVVAPTSDASRDVLVSEGYENATTIASLLVSKELQKQLQDGVLWVDEAPMMGNRDMIAVLELAKQHNTRVVLGGDVKQHSAVMRGDAVRLLNTIGGIRAAEVTKIYRQKDKYYRSAVEDLAKGDVLAAFEKLTEIDAIKTVDPLAPNDELVNDYVAAVKKGKSTLIVSPTHEQGDKVTTTIRQRLQAEKLLGKRELNALKLKNLSFTEAQKADWRNFRPNQYVQFNQNLPKIRRGSGWIVKTSDKTGVIVENNKGVIQRLPQDRAACFQVYEQFEIPLAKGDKVRITNGAFDLEKNRLNNGQMFVVKSIDKSGIVKLENPISKSKCTLDKSFGHIDHAYCTTSHASQGKTVDCVFISQPASTFTASNSKQFYVSVSRGRDSVTIYTDDREELLNHVALLGDRTSAMELVGKDHQQYVDTAIRKEYTTDKTPGKNRPAKAPIKQMDYEYEP